MVKDFLILNEFYRTGGTVDTIELPNIAVIAPIGNFIPLMRTKYYWYYGFDAD